jgi:hypothetical protein
MKTTLCSRGTFVFTAFVTWLSAQAAFVQSDTTIFKILEHILIESFDDVFCNIVIDHPRSADDALNPESWSPTAKRMTLLGVSSSPTAV